MPMPPSDGQPDVTLHMNAAADGDTAAADRLLPLVYARLRRAAQQRLAREREGHTLSATALVHEAYLKLVGPRQIPWAGRGHFYGAAAQSMRRILIDHARRRAALGGGGLGLEDIGDVGALHLVRAMVRRARRGMIGPSVLDAERSACSPR